MLAVGAMLVLPTFVDDNLCTWNGSAHARGTDRGTHVLRIAHSPLHVYHRGPHDRAWVHTGGRGTISWLHLHAGHSRVARLGRTHRHSSAVVRRPVH